jgi:hypothetical protein
VLAEAANGIGTGVTSCPDLKKLSRLRSVSSSIAARVSTVPLATCGSSTTFSIAHTPAPRRHHDGDLVAVCRQKLGRVIREHVGRVVILKRLRQGRFQQSDLQHWPVVPGTGFGTHDAYSSAGSSESTRPLLKIVK